MSIQYEQEKWYKVSEPPTPQFHGSIYFVTKNGTMYAGTYNGYSQFLSLDEDVFHKNEVEKWKIRERKTEQPKEDSLTYKGKKINVKARDDIGFYWRASYLKDGDEIYVNKESKDEAIEKLKNKIDQLQ